MALIVFGVVLQQPPTREAPSLRQLSTCDTNPSSETPVFCCNTSMCKVTVNLASYELENKNEHYGSHLEFQKSKQHQIDGKI